ncbi:MAG: TonB-dependent receptor [Bacteroidetes bacterium]|nr:TonB-dependent receptor [Bacteroidota bacterium]
MRNFFYQVCLGCIVLVGISKAQQPAHSGKTNPTTGNSKSFLTGKITSQKSGSPLIGASIYLHEAKNGAVSDTNGVFVSPSIPTGKYLVEISYQGFATIIENIEISGKTMKDFSMIETVVEHEEVTVTGVASATRTKLSSQPISIIKRSDLFQSSSSNIIDAISKMVPGVASLGTGPAISKPVIRGLGYNRVVTVHDGVRQEGQQWGDEHGIEVDEYSIQKVELLKGPASLFYGSDAMAGVVHLITNVPVQKGIVSGNVMTTYNSNNGLFGTNANLAGHLKSGFNWNAYGTYKNAGDYQNAYDGKVFNSRFNERNFGGYIGINKTWGYSHIIISNFNQHIGVIEGARDPITGQFLVYPETPQSHIATSDELNSRILSTPYQQVTHFKIASDNNFVVGTDRMTVNIGFQQNRRREFGDESTPNHPDLYFDLKTISYGLQYHFAEKNGWINSIGLTGMYQQNRNLAEEVLIPEYNLFDVGAFFYTKKTFDKITISGGARADNRSLSGFKYVENGQIRFSDFKHTFSNLSGSIGLSYSASESITWKLNIARSYRAPSVSELASNGAHEGTNRYEYGEQNLQSETAFQVDGGFEYNEDHISFALSAFYNNIQNYIFYSKLESMHGGDSLVHQGGSDLVAFKFKQAIASLYGFEAKLDIHPHPLDWLHFENNFSLVAAHFNQSFEGSNKLPFIPSPRLLSVLRANFNKQHKQFRNSYVKLELDNVSAQNRVFTAYNTETATPGYTLLNFGAGTDMIHNGKTIFSIYVGLNNLTDVAYQNHLSRLKYTEENAATGRMGVFNMGRNFSIKLNMPLSFKTKA